jgi:AcrR family transcriptional regulator
MSTSTDHRDERRAARRAQDRNDILDAAERVFAVDGLRGGSLRSIAAEAGYSPAALYLFFDNKEALVTETLTRRGDELISRMSAIADGGATPIQKLHAIADDAIAFFTERPSFRSILRHLRGTDAIVGSVLTEYAKDDTDRFAGAMGILARLVRDGQGSSELRPGNSGAIAQLYSVLVNEYVLISADQADADALTAPQFHALLDGALRAPRSSPR